MGERVTAREAIALVCDDFVEAEPVGRPCVPDGPIAWEGYDAARARAAERTGSKESVVYGEATLGGRRCVVVSFEFGFLGGSLSIRAGDRLEAAYGAARERRRPLISLIATGGSRMQEGMVALSQLQRVAHASVLLRDAGVPHIAVLRDPTTGGGWATLGAGADVILALPTAQVGFAGSRVRPPEADPAAYTAEGQLASGQIDAIVRGEDLREVLAYWAGALGAGLAGAEAEGHAADGPGVPGAPPAAGTPGTGSGAGAGLTAEGEHAGQAASAPESGPVGTPGAAGPQAAPAVADPPRVEPAPPPYALGGAPSPHRMGRRPAGPRARTAPCRGVSRSVLHTPPPPPRRSLRRHRPRAALRCRAARRAAHRVRRPVRHPDPARRVPHRRPCRTARRPGRDSRAHTHRHPGRGQ